MVDYLYHSITPVEMEPFPNTANATCPMLWTSLYKYFEKLTFNIFADIYKLKFFKINNFSFDRLEEEVLLWKYEKFTSQIVLLKSYKLQMLIGPWGYISTNGLFLINEILKVRHIIHLEIWIRPNYSSLTELGMATGRDGAGAGQV